MSETQIPPGWHKNPSAWTHRLPVLGFALLGLAIALYLTLFQYGVLPTVWDPFFGESSQAVLTSWISQLIHKYTSLPITDGALGAFAYFLDVILCASGGTARWRERPWVVLLFGINAACMGVAGILLVIAQGAVLHHWCTLCLASAAISIGLVWPSLTEARAAVQHLR
jgi:hypothetical protein